MSVVLSDAQIAALMAEPKPSIDASDLLKNMRLVENQQLRASIRVSGERGSSFVLHVRQSALDPFDFSVILVYSAGARSLNLRRHNGSNHAHVNKIEGDRVDFVPHVHIASARYQELGYDAEGYAEETDEYSDVAGPVRSMLSASGFSPPAQISLL